MGSDGSDIPRREPWWFWTWTVWGLVCGSVVGVVDQAATTGLAWAGAAALVGLFGEPLFRQICSHFFKRPKTRHGHPGDGGEAPPDRASLMRYLSEENIQLLDPNRKRWDGFWGIVLASALFHGVLGGGLLGALLPWTSSWQVTALGGALAGMMLGPIVLSPLFAVVLASTITVARGPRVDAVRGIFDVACREAEHHGHDHLIPAHLLLGVLRASGGAISGIETADADRLRESCEELDNALANRTIQLVDETTIAEVDQVYDALQTAIDEARALKQPRVEAGHLLLGLLWTWPSGTTRTLVQLGIDPVEPREDLRNRLRRAA